MKRFAALALMLLLLLGLASAQATIGRDILLVYRATNDWTGGDTVLILNRDGSRTQFDLTGIPHEERNDLVKLLDFLRLHGLGPRSPYPQAAEPVELEPVSQGLVNDIVAQLAKVKDSPFEPSFYAFDAGHHLFYGLIQVEGEGTLTLLSQGGTYRGQSEDPAAQALLNLAGPFLLGE